MIPSIQQTYSITVVTVVKTKSNYLYSSEDTVQNLKEKIAAEEGIPTHQQRLYVQYGWRKCWAQIEISENTTDLLINYLRTASRINLYIKLKNT